MEALTPKLLASDPNPLIATPTRC